MMENIKVKVKAERLPSRCETCHQSDCFDPINNHCSRCHDVVAMETSGTWNCLRCNLVNNRTFQACRRCGSPLSNHQAFQQIAAEPKYLVRFNEGIAYLNHQNYAIAISIFEDTIKANYKVAQCYYLIGNAYLGLKQLAQAEAAYKRTLELENNHEFARDALARFCKTEKMGTGSKVLICLMIACLIYFLFLILL